MSIVSIDEINEGELTIQRKLMKFYSYEDAKIQIETNGLIQYGPIYYSDTDRCCKCLCGYIVSE